MGTSRVTHKKKVQASSEFPTSVAPLTSSALGSVLLSVQWVGSSWVKSDSDAFRFQAMGLVP